MTGATFDRIMGAGRAAVLAGRHVRERPPAETGRWGTSVVLLATGDIAVALDVLSKEASDVAGRGHWRSGGRGRAHATVRALERYTHEPLDGGTAARYTSALERAAAAAGSVLLEFDGLALSAGSVMACATSRDRSADDLRHGFGVELGADAWLEDEVLPNGRDPIWYISIVHFTDVVENPERLVEWVEERRSIPIGSATFNSVALCRWEFDGEAMRPTPVTSVALGP